MPVYLVIGKLFMVLFLNVAPDKYHHMSLLGLCKSQVTQSVVFTNRLFPSQLLLQLYI